MEQITLIKRNGTSIKLFNKDPFRTVKTATQSKSLMGVDTVTLSILSRQILSFDKGDRIVVKGENYYIRTKVNRELTSDGYFKYDAIFYGVLYDLMKTPYRNMDASGNSSTSTFDLVYDLKEYIRVLINNTNKDYPGWWVFNETGCPDKDPIPFQFSCNNCLEVLQQVCQKFKVDFRITQNNNVRTIQIGHFGDNITPPDGSSYFEWGRGKGLYSLKENKVDDKAIKTRLWVEGGTSNLPTGYRDYAMRLQLPLSVVDGVRRKNKHEHTLSDGTVIEANSEYIGISSENARYIEDTALSQTLGVDADSVLYDEIVPTRTGTVTAIYSGGENPDYLSFADSSMDFDINESLVNNVSAKVTFITGKLAGQELEISKYDATAKKFTLIPYQDSRGLTIPTEDSEAFRIGVGDKYKLTDIVMPQAIIDDAEEELWYAGYDDLCKLKQARVQYTMELNRMKLLEDMPTDSDTVLFKPGDYVPIKDTRFGVQKNIRIQKVERNLLLRHDYHLTISDTATIDVITQSVVDTQNHEVIIINNQLRDLSKKRRGWRTTEELRTMVFDTDGYFDTDNFRANSIDTNMLTVGSKSQQFVLSGVVIQPNYGGNANRIVISAGSLVHLTINENSARLWNLTASDTTMGNNTGYYLYARCAKSGDNGVWLVTQTQYKADPDGDYYYFLVGVIGSAYAASGGHTAYRDFTSTYGFTRINGNTITTGKIVTDDGYNYLDLDGAKFRIGDADSSLDYNVTANKQLTLRNVKLMSGTAEDPIFSDIGVYRGVYNSSYTYYKGDEVSYTSGGATATYRYINNTPSSGHAPTDTAYWSVVAQGKNGNPGSNADKIMYFYRWAATKPAAPTGTSISPAGWHTKPEREDITPTYNGTFSFRNGFRHSPATDHSGASVERVTFTTTLPNQIVAVQLYVSSEANYDWAYIGKLDQSDYANNYEAKISGTSNQTVYLFVATAGSHYFDVAYKKDGSTVAGTDECWYRIITTASLCCWVSQAVVSGSSGNVTSWSDPVRFVWDSDTEESVYLLSETSTVPSAPASEPLVDDYVPTITSEYWDSSKTYAVGNKVMATFNAYAYECIQACTNVDVTNTSYWKRIPTWTDDPETVDSTYRYQFVSVRKKVNGQWGAFGTPTIFTQYIKGDPGTNGNYYELRYAKNGSPTSPPSLVVTDRNPSGWSTAQPSVATLEYLWETRALISGTNNTLLSNWTTPIRRNPVDAVNLGENLVDNSDAPENYEITNCTSESPKYIKTEKRMCRLLATGTKISGQVRITLTGCSPKSGGGQVLVYINGTNSYPRVGEKTGITSSTITLDLKSEDVTYNVNGGTMYKDIYIRLINFNDGGVVTIERVKVEVGSQCSAWSLSEADKRGPAVIYRGVYDSSTVYVGSALRIDCVKYNGVYYAARYDAGEFSNHAPDDADYWNGFGAQFESVATSLLLAEFAYIENLGVRHLLTAESGKRVHISGDDNSMTIYDSDDQASVIFSGDVFSDSDLFGGTTQTLSPSVYNKSYVTGSALHPNSNYRSTTTQCSFTTTKAGVCSGSFTVKVSVNGSYTPGSGMSQVPYAAVRVYLDDMYLGLAGIADFNGSFSDERTFSFSKNLSIGSHTLKAVIEITNPNYSSGSYTITGKNTFSNVKVEYDLRASRYFANGNAIGCSSSQFSETLIQNSKLLHRVQSGNAGIEINDGTFKVRIAGVWYTASVETINSKKHIVLT